MKDLFRVTYRKEFNLGGGKLMSYPFSHSFGTYDQALLFCINADAMGAVDMVIDDLTNVKPTDMPDADELAQAHRNNEAWRKKVLS